MVSRAWFSHQSPVPLLYHCDFPLCMKGSDIVSHTKRVVLPFFSHSLVSSFREWPLPSMATTQPPATIHCHKKYFFKKFPSKTPAIWSASNRSMFFLSFSSNGLDSWYKLSLVLSFHCIFVKAPPVSTHAMCQAVVLSDVITDTFLSHICLDATISKVGCFPFRIYSTFRRLFSLP